MAFPDKTRTAVALARYTQPFLTIDCGEWTYGIPTLQLASADSPRTLRIGRYCSIGHGVEIFIGRQGRHSLDTISTYPMEMAVAPAVREQGDLRVEHPDLFRPSSVSEATQLDVEIGDDVWIGANATILAGVRIGTGAVIGTRSVVTRDVPPYAVVGGAPARILRYRHQPDVVAALLSSRWWRLDPDEIWQRCGSLFSSRRVTDVLPFLSGDGPAGAAGQKATDDVTRLRTLVSRLRFDLANAPDVLGGLPAEDLVMLFSPVRDFGAPLPIWPAEQVQRHYTAGFDLPLMKRTEAFVGLLDKDGAFRRPDWRGLDFGCGWGRIASYLLTKGSPDQLDLCDAWENSLRHVARNGFRNRRFAVPEVLTDGAVPKGEYDVIYAFSIFTHLSRPGFEAGLAVLAAGLRPGGRLYVTVRHADFLDMMRQDNRPVADMDLKSIGFWFGTTTANPAFGDSVISPEYFADLTRTLGAVRYLGLPEPFQHLYAIERPS